MIPQVSPHPSDFHNLSSSLDTQSSRTDTEFSQMDASSLSEYREQKDDWQQSKLPPVQLQPLDEKDLVSKQYQDHALQMVEADNGVIQVSKLSGNTVYVTPVLTDSSDNGLQGIITDRQLKFSAIHSCFRVIYQQNNGSRYFVRVDNMARLNKKGKIYQLTEQGTLSVLRSVSV